MQTVMLRAAGSRVGSAATDGAAVLPLVGSARLRLGWEVGVGSGKLQQKSGNGNVGKTRDPRPGPMSREISLTAS